MFQHNIHIYNKKNTKYSSDKVKQSITHFTQTFISKEKLFITKELIQNS